MEPKILAKGKFSPNDLLVSISPSSRKIDTFVESKIEEVWEKMVANAREKNQNLYNGISYRLNSLKQKKDKLLIDLGTFEYKVRDGLIVIPEYFDLHEEYWRKGCFTQSTIKTNDGQYLMAELSGKSMNKNNIDFLGGVMEIPPEVKNGEDIFKSLYSELEEEGFITPLDIKECFLKLVFITNNHNIGFYFEAGLNISSQKLTERYKNLNMEADIKSIKIFSRDEYLETLRTHKSPNKRLLTNLVEI